MVAILYQEEIYWHTSCRNDAVNESMSHITKPIKVSVLYDNLAFREDMSKDWGFSCLIQGMPKTILFDTGASGKILLGNMEKLGLSPRQVEVVLISHEHKDHAHGLESLLDENPNIEVWLPDFFSQAYKDSVCAKGAELVSVNEFQNICEGVYTTGIIAGWIKEQSLILQTPNGLVLITGCAHPRLVKIIDHVLSFFDSQIYLVMGGFHLAGFEKNEIQAIIKRCRQAGVQKVGPAHCSGELAHTLFRNAYGSDYIKIGVGQEIIIPGKTIKES